MSWTQWVGHHKCKCRKQWVKIPSYPNVLVNRSVLCNCGIEVENNFLLESLTACHDAESKLVLYFMVNTVLSITLIT